MDERWGGEWELGGSLFLRTGHVNLMSPGGHRWRTAVIAGNKLDLSRPQYKMTDIYRIIMENAQ